MQGVKGWQRQKGESLMYRTSRMRGLDARGVRLENCEVFEAVSADQPENSRVEDEPRGLSLIVCIAVGNAKAQEWETGILRMREKAISEAVKTECQRIAARESEGNLTKNRCQTDRGRRATVEFAKSREKALEPFLKASDGEKQENARKFDQVDGNEGKMMTLMTRDAENSAKHGKIRKNQ